MDQSLRFDGDYSQSIYMCPGKLRSGVENLTCLLCQLQSGGYLASMRLTTHSDSGAVCTLVHSSQNPCSTIAPAPDQCVSTLPCKEYTASPLETPHGYWYIKVQKRQLPEHRVFNRMCHLAT